MAPTRRLLYFVLVTVVTFVCLAHSAQGIGDNLSSTIDADLFLEDEGASGDSDLEASNSGNGPPDDEDMEGPRTGGGYVGSETKITNNKEKPQNPSPVDPEKPPKFDNDDFPINSNEVNVFNQKEDPQPSFFSQPGILAAIICGAIVGLLCAILLVMFIVYRMRKKDEGSYVLDDSKRTSSSYGKAKEFFA